MLRSFVSLVALGALACGSPAGPVAVAATERQAIRLLNNTPEPIFYFAIECDAAAGANWAACSNPATCRNILPGRSGSIAYEEISLYTPSAERALVFWWHLRPTGTGGYRPDSIRALQVALHRPGA